MSIEDDRTAQESESSGLTRDDVARIELERKPLRRARLFATRVAEIGTILASSHIKFHIDTSELETAWGSDITPDTFTLNIVVTCPEIPETDDDNKRREKIRPRRKISKLLSNLALLWDGDNLYQDNRTHGTDGINIFYIAEFSNREITGRKYGKLEKKVDKLVRELRLDQFPLK